MIAIIGTISLLILSWVAVISIIFWLLILAISIITIIKNQKSKTPIVTAESEKIKPTLNLCGDTNMKKCTYCNSDIPNEAKFCERCGAPLLTEKVDADYVSRSDRRWGTLFIVLGMFFSMSLYYSHVSTFRYKVILMLFKN